MRLKKYCGFLLCFLLLCTGCTHDKALVLPVTQEETKDDTRENLSAENVGAAVSDAEGEAVDAGMDVTTAEETECEAAVICVYVCGAVNNAGVVTLPEGSRVADALEAAGGFGPDAREDSVNLAELLSDGQMVRFPRVDEEILPDTGSSEADGRVNINVADETLLTSLKGIGRSRAQDIIAYREQNGPFESIEDIMKVPGIKDSIYERIRDSIKVR